MTFGLGVAAATTAPLVMTVGFIAWENHWSGSAFALNMFKCNTAAIGFLVLACVSRSNPFPAEVFTAEAVGYMFLSSTIGIVIGDWTWLEALRLLGARKVILMDSIKPFLAAFLGWLILNEELRYAAIGGICLTVAGVLVVSLQYSKKDRSRSDPEKVEDDGETPGSTHSSLGEETSSIPLERSALESDNEVPPDASDSKPHRNPRKGFPYAFLNVALDTYGAVLIKQHGQAFRVWEINLLRFGFAGILMLVISLAMITAKGLRRAGADAEQSEWYLLPLSTMARSSWYHVSIGVLLVTFATPSLSNYALFEIALAFALTLGSIGPLYSVPLTYLLQKEAPTLRGVLGALLAVSGVAVLAWKGTIPNNR
jgi:drug/metabolite transporter (DMT)-like permease